MAMCLSRLFRSLASKTHSTRPLSFLLNKRTTSPLATAIFASCYSSIVTANHHQRKLLFPFPSSHLITHYPNTNMRPFSSKPENNPYLIYLNDPKAVTLTSIIHEHALAGRTKEALHAYTRFLESYIKPDSTYTYNVLIEALAADPKFVVDAKHCLWDMVGGALPHMLPSDRAAMAVYEEAYVKQGNAEEGKMLLRFLQEMKGDDSFRLGGPHGMSSDLSDTENYSKARSFIMQYFAYDMFRYLMEEGLTNEAMDMRTYIFEKGEMPAVVLLTFKIVMCDNAGKAEMALDEYKLMIARGTSPNVYAYNVLIEALAKEPKFIGDAKKYLLEMKHKGMRPNVGAYLAMLKAFDQAGKVEECWDIVDQIRAQWPELDEKIRAEWPELHEKIPGIRDSLTTASSSSNRTTIKVNSPRCRSVVCKDDDLPSLPMLDSIMARPGDPEDFPEVYNKVCSKEGFLKSLIRMYDNLERDGYKDYAAEMMYEWTERGCIHPDVILTGVVDEYAETGKTIEAFHVFRKISGPEISINIRRAPNPYAYSIIIKALAANSDPNLLGLAKDLLLEMMGKGMQPAARTYAAVYEAFVVQDKMEEAKQFLREIKANGFVANRKAYENMRKVLQGKEAIVKIIIDILFDNSEGFSDDSDCDDVAVPK